MLAGCVGLTATVALRPGLRVRPAPHRQGELFAFVAPDRDDVVFALAMDRSLRRTLKAIKSTVRLHAGDYLWTFDPFVRGTADFALQSGDRLFSGLVSRVRREAAAHLVAVAVPAERLPLQRLDVWAEIIGADGTRSRIGNPVVSGLLADDARLLKLHAELHPAVDRRLLSEAIADRIAARPDSGKPGPGRPEPG